MAMLNPGMTRRDYRMGLRAGGLSGDNLRTAMGGFGGAQTSPAMARQAFRAGGMSGDALHGAMQGFRQGSVPGDPVPPAPTAPMGTPAWMKDLYTTQQTGVNEPQPTGMPQTPLFNTFSDKSNPLASLSQNFNPGMGGFTPTEQFQKPEDFYRGLWDSLGGGYQKSFQQQYAGDPWIEFLTGGGQGGSTEPLRGNDRKAAMMSTRFGALR